MVVTAAEYDHKTCCSLSLGCVYLTYLSVMLHEVHTVTENIE